MDTKTFIGLVGALVFLIVLIARIAFKAGCISSEVEQMKKELADIKKFLF